MKNITFVIAVYNEEDSIPHLMEMYDSLWSKLNANVLFVNDGSNDNTLASLRSYAQKSTKIGYVNLSRNFGKEQAIAAGLSQVPDDQNVVIIDGDGQHTPEAVSKLIEHMEADPALDIVFGVRETREYQGFLDRTFSKGFYSVINLMLSHPLDNRLGDFFLAKSSILPALKMFRDSKLFWKGIYSWVGFNRAVVPVTIEDRREGKSKFSFFKKLALAIDGVVWLTKVPLYAISILGLVIASISFLFALWFVGQWFLTGVSVPGFYTLAVMQAFVAGVMMLSLGVIALYMAVIFENTSSKPGFLLSSENKKPKW